MAHVAGVLLGEHVRWPDGLRHGAMIAATLARDQNWAAGSRSPRPHVAGHEQGPKAVLKLSTFPLTSTGVQLLRWSE